MAKNKLVNLNLTNVDVVNVGAQQDAFISIKKSKEEVKMDLKQLIAKALTGLGFVKKTGESTFEDNLQVNEAPYAVREIAWNINDQLWQMYYALSAAISDIVCSDANNKDQLIRESFSQFTLAANTLFDDVKDGVVIKSADGSKTKDKLIEFINKSFPSEVIQEEAKDETSADTAVEPDNVQVEKSASELVEKAEDSEVVKLRKQVEALQDEKRLGEFVAKASTLGNIPVPANELGMLLKSASDKLGDDYGKLVSLLEAANNITKASTELFESNGISKSDLDIPTTESEFDTFVITKAKRIAKDKSISYTDAVDEYRGTEEYKSLKKSIK